MKLDMGKVLTAATLEQAHAGQMGWFGDSIMDLIGAMKKNPVELKEIRSEFLYHFLDSTGKGYLFFYPSDEPVKYRPFNEAGLNQLIGKVIVKKSTGKRSVITQAFNNAVGSWGFDIDARDLLEYYTFDDGTPCGVKEDKEISRHNTGVVDENGLLPCPVKTEDPSKPFFGKAGTVFMGYYEQGWKACQPIVVNGTAIGEVVVYGKTEQECRDNWNRLALIGQGEKR